MRLNNILVEVSKSSIKKNQRGKFQLTPKNLSLVKEFILTKWKERAVELKQTEPHDLSYSCKFSTIFIQKIFGGRIKGNYDHQYNVIDGNVVDINIEAEDVLALDDPHKHDELFFGNQDHVESLRSCEPRINAWIKEFIDTHSNQMETLKKS